MRAASLGWAITSVLSSRSKTPMGSDAGAPAAVTGAGNSLAALASSSLREARSSWPFQPLIAPACRVPTFLATAWAESFLLSWRARMISPPLRCPAASRETPPAIRLSGDSRSMPVAALMASCISLLSLVLGSSPARVFSMRALKALASGESLIFRPRELAVANTMA